MKSTLAKVVTTETDVPFGRDNEPVVAVVVETDVRLETRCREWLIRVHYERSLVRSSFEGVQVRHSLVPLAAVASEESQDDWEKPHLIIIVK